MTDREHIEEIDMANTFLDPSLNIAIPQPFTVFDQGDPIVGQTIDQFFNHILQALQVTDRERSSHQIHKEIRELYRDNPSQKIVTNDQLTELLWHDMVLATVFERRNDFNRTQVYCACFLTEDMHAKLQDRRCPYLHSG